MAPRSGSARPEAAETYGPARLRDARGGAAYAGRVQILWWLLPPALVTGLAMAWVSWLGRDGRGAVDPDVAVRRMAEALSRPAPQVYASARRRERSTGVAVRPSSRPTQRVEQKRRAS